MGPEVSAESYQWWKENFDKMLADPKFAELRKQRELLPFAMTGDELTQYVYKETEKLRALSAEFNLVEKSGSAPAPTTTAPAKDTVSATASAPVTASVTASATASASTK